MIEITFEPINVVASDIVNEIESDEETVTQPLIECSKSATPSEDNEDEYLSTPDSFIIHTPAPSSEISRVDTPTSTRSHTPAQALATESATTTQMNQSSQPKMIGLDLDTNNILPEGVKRSRIRKQVYAVNLENVVNDHIICWWYVCCYYYRWENNPYLSTVWAG
jgi:hypothetical protein